jgi:capsular polysaccharide export protein
MSQQRVLFVGLSEREVPAFAYIADILGPSAASRVVTWLPRLANDRVTSLYDIAKRGVSSAGDRQLLGDAGLEFPDVAADFDRDWRFGARSAKTKHVLRVTAAVRAVLDEHKPDLVVSSVGGETTRVVLERLCKHRGIPTAFFNAVPHGRRFALIKSMDAPFVPYEGGMTSYRPGELLDEQIGASKSAGGAVEAGTSGLFERAHLEPLARLGQVLTGSRGAYPPGWFARKAWASGTGALLGTTHSSGRTPARGRRETVILYPLHDERDFQVAVRERHAIPQSAFLRYVASTLPSGYRLWVKPHPEHRAAHHRLNWRNLANVSNVKFLEPDVTFAEAINACDVVLTLASTMGFEALKVGRPVVCYGRPFYSNRNLTVDVADPRSIAGAVQSAVGSTPDEQRLQGLISDMQRWSWPGQFTPLDLSAENLTLLAAAIDDVQRGLSRDPQLRDRTPVSG